VVAMAGNVADVVNVVNVRIVASQDGLPVARYQFPEKDREDSQISQDSSNSSDSQMDFVNLANRWDGSGGDGGGDGDGESGFDGDCYGLVRCSFGTFR